MSFPSYPQYKDSGVQWLGEVPEHWDVFKLKRLANNERYSFVDGPFGSGLKNEEYTESGVPLIQLNNIAVGSHILNDTKFVSEEKADKLGKHNAFSGDIVVAKMAEPVARAALVADSFSRYVIVADCIRLSLDDEVAKAAFVVYAINSPYFRSNAENRSSGITRLRINLGALKQIKIVLPQPSEQTVIASFLDRETAKIDELVAEQQRLIELLKEKNQAVIFHAVTKGLNRDAPMKDSGVEWVGEVPVHWKVVPIKRVCRMESGHTPRKSNEVFWVAHDCTIPWISLNDTKMLDTSDYINDTVVKISEVGMNNSSAHLIDKGAVVMNRDGARVGLASITRVPMCVSQHIIAWVCGSDVINRYLLHIIYAMNAELYRLAGGATIPTIGMSDVKGMKMTLPPLSEQIDIVEFLVEQRRVLSDLINKAQQNIDLLQERRTALISAAVTGQIDVHHLI